ncbi:hypothetical protein VUR80DRAFT_9272 [Thermomyces stellatus]
MRHILLQVQLDEHPFPPQMPEETLPEKARNNRTFSKTLPRLFEIMPEWDYDDALLGGISLELAVSSPSDYRKLPYNAWREGRRLYTADIGDKRFLNSAVDFFGQDDKGRKIGLLKPVYAISSFEASPIGYRTDVPGAYGEIISALPRLRRVSLAVFRLATRSKEDALLALRFAVRALF